MAETQETRECPYCKEEIKAEAIKCKYCGSRLTPERPGHEGTCPFCKEDINLEAIKCKHCMSMLNDNDSDCGCGQGDTFSPAPSPITRTSASRAFPAQGGSAFPGMMSNQDNPAGVAYMVGGGFGGGFGGGRFGLCGCVIRSRWVKYCGGMYGYYRCSWVLEDVLECSCLPSD